MTPEQLAEGFIRKLPAVDWVDDEGKLRPADVKEVADLIRQREADVWREAARMSEKYWIPGHSVAEPIVMKLIHDFVEKANDTVAAISKENLVKE